MKILMIGCRWFMDDVADRHDMAFAEQLQIAGGNSGNLLIGEAVRAHLKRLLPGVKRIDYFSFSDIRLTDGKSLRGHYDYIVMAASNMLHPGVNFGFLTRFVEASDLPLIILGLGAQAESDEADFRLPAATIRLVAYAAQSRAGVGVRGRFTADLLARQGISNTRVIGCPSAYLRGAAAPPIAPPPQGDVIGRAVFSYKRDRNRYASDALLKPVQRQMLQVAIKRGFDYIAQANFAECWLGFHGTASLSSAAQDKFSNMGRYFGMPCDPGGALAGYVADHLRCHFTWRGWQAQLQGAAFACGSRFHGNMMALLAGVPAVWFLHDTRTRELCAALDLPGIEVRALADDGFSLERVLAQADYSRFNARYAEKCAAFDSFLSAQFQPGASHVAAVS